MHFSFCITVYIYCIHSLLEYSEPVSMCFIVMLPILENDNLSAECCIECVAVAVVGLLFVDGLLLVDESLSCSAKSLALSSLSSESFCG